MLLETEYVFTYNSQLRLVTVYRDASGELLIDRSDLPLGYTADFEGDFLVVRDPAGNAVELRYLTGFYWEGRIDAVRIIEARAANRGRLPR